MKRLCSCGNRLFADGDDYGASLVLLPDSLDRPLHERISLLLRRADTESGLAVKLRDKLREVAGADIASSI